MFKRQLISAAVLAALLQTPVMAQEDSSVTAEMRAQLTELQARIQELEQRLAEQEQAEQERAEQLAQAQNEQETDSVESSRSTERTAQTNEATEKRFEALEADVAEAQNTPIEVGGAVRFQYVYEDYNDGNKDRGGDLDFDIFRLNFRGEIGDVILSAEYRWFQYMDVVQHAYFGYDFTDEWQGQVGIVGVPFGIRPYNSHSYFFNAPFYAGLEDEYDAGTRFLYRTDTWDFDIGFYKSDEQGGVDSGASSRADKYSYDPVGIRLPGEDIFGNPELAIGENNSWALRGARKFQLGEERDLELGLSVQWGDLHDGAASVGDRQAWAAHAVYNHERWEFMAQVADYEYDVDIENDGIIVGAYAYFDTIPSAATFYTGNVAYTLPVQFGPVTDLTFYNNYSLMTDKEGYTDDTFMNVTGMAVTAGGVYTYFDLVVAENQPFVGGSMAEEGGDTNTRFNINFGYYF